MTKPFVKCLGGKAELAPRIVAAMPIPNYSVYVEPFVGGGAVFFYMKKEGLLGEDHTVILGDADEHLIEVYAEIQNDPHGLRSKTQELADELAAADDPDAYYRSVRGNWNDGCREAHHCFFLHRAAFNGLWRMNSKGEMNAAWNKKEKVYIPPIGEMLEASTCLQDVELLDWDFRQYEEEDLIGPETLVYLDPPYHGGFVDYIPAGFSEEDQVDLIQLAKRWEDKGAHIVYSNAPTDWVVDQLMDIWPTCVLTDDIEMRRSINRDGDGRGKVPELLAHSPMRGDGGDG